MERNLVVDLGGEVARPAEAQVNDGPEAALPLPRVPLEPVVRASAVLVINLSWLVSSIARVNENDVMAVFGRLVGS